MDALLALVLTLLVDTSFSWMRMLAALALSIAIGLCVGILAGRSERAGAVITPIIDVLQTLPIVTFFPLAIFAIVSSAPGYAGINIAVVFLIITSMAWNIIFGVYEAIRTLPAEFIELARIYGLTRFERLRKIYVPASMPKVVEQSMLSWSIGLFYLVTSEIFSAGNSQYSVRYGIGIALTNLAISGNFVYYGIGIAIFVAFVIATRFLLFEWMERRYLAHLADAEKTGQIQAQGSNDGKIFGGEVFKTLVGKLNVGKLQQHIGNVGNAFAPGRALGKPRIRIKISVEVQLSSWQKLVVAEAAIALAAYVAYSYGFINSATLAYEQQALAALAASFARVWLAFAVVVAVAIPIGVYIVFLSKHERFFTLLLQILSSIPATILLPIIALSLKGYPMHNELVAFIVFFLSGIWYMVFSIISVKSNITPSMVEAKKVFDIKGVSAWRHFYLKAILPGLITGGITCVAAEWNASIVAERFTTSVLGSGAVITSVNAGMGKLLDVALGSGNLGLMTVALGNLTVMIIIINRLLWKRAYRKASSVYA